MFKLSKQDKIEIYHLWHDYQIGPAELSQRYQVGRSNIGYLLALIDRHGLAILDQPFTAYTSNFKEQALRQIIVDHEPLYHVALDLGLKNHGISQSMSRKGNSLDDGSMEGFFGILKREMFYGFEKHLKNLTELEDAIRDYIEYYNHKRIKIKLKGLTPIEYRQLVLS